jgi:spore maturation protein SpmB
MDHNPDVTDDISVVKLARKKINKSSVISFLTAIMAPVSYCGASVFIASWITDGTPPSDLITGILLGLSAILYLLVPSALAVIAVITGISGLRQIKKSAESGKVFSIIGIVLGILVAGAFACLFVSVFALFVQYLVTLL